MDEAQHLITVVFGLLQQVKLFHWATTSYAKHAALDKLHEALSDKTDLLVESYIGKAKKQPLKQFTVQASSSTDTNKIDKYLESERDKLQKLSDALFAKHPELQNIIHDIMSEIDKALYLCRLS